MVRPQADQSADPCPPKESGSSGPQGTDEVELWQAGKMASPPKDSRESLTVLDICMSHPVRLRFSPLRALWPNRLIQTVRTKNSHILPVLPSF